MPGVDLPRSVRDSHLEDRLCQVDPDLRSVHHGLLLHVLAFGAVALPGTLWCRRGGGVHPISTCAGAPLFGARGPRITACASSECVAAGTWLRRGSPNSVRAGL